MGSSFSKTFIRQGNFYFTENRIDRAAKDIGYQISVPGKGVPVSLRLIEDRETEWYQITSPVLDAGGEMAETFSRALSRELKQPVLHLDCCDSDFARCALFDGKSGTGTLAWINRPYDESEITPADEAAWLSSCYKKWKCKEEDFSSVFSGEYVFAEDGLKKLADLIRLPAEWIASEEDEKDEVVAERWILSSEETGGAPVRHTIEELLSDDIEQNRAEELTARGYKKYNNSPLCWFKVTGREGNEVVCGFAFPTHYDCFEPFFCAQSIYCPLKISNRYYPLHDRDETWEEARHIWSEIWYEKNSDGMSVHYPIDPERAMRFLENMVNELDQMTDLSAVREWKNRTRQVRWFKEEGNSNGIGAPLAYRMFVEALLDGAEEEAKFWSRATAAKLGYISPRFADGEIYDKGLITALPRIYVEQGREACLEELKKVRETNLRRLKKAGIL